MPLYRVDFYLDDKIIASVEVRAWSRKEAWFESWSTTEYKAVKDKGRIMFDATEIQ